MSIAVRLDHAISEMSEVARRGNELDHRIDRLDPSALRARLTTFHEQAQIEPSTELDAAIASVERQLETAERLRVLSNRAATQLRLTITRIDELVARIEQVGTGLTDIERHERDLEALIDELGRVGRAIDETRASGPTDDRHVDGRRDGAADG